MCIRDRVERIAALPFVRETEKVWIAPGGDGPFMATERDSLINLSLIHILSMRRSANALFTCVSMEVSVVRNLLAKVFTSGA